MAKINIVEVSSYLPARCGIATFTQEQLSELQTNEDVRSFAVATIDSSRGKLHYNSPADKKLVIDAFDINSWRKTARGILNYADSRAECPTCVILQHEYGLDKTQEGNAYQEMANIFREAGEDKIITLASLHTVRSEPSQNQKKALVELAELTDGVIVPSHIALDILNSEIYNIPRHKLKHIDHGIRVENISTINPDEVKQRYNLEGKCIITTAGLKSPGKGIEFGIESYGDVLNKHFSVDSQERKKLVYLIAGEFHPTWVKENPEEYEKYKQKLQEVLNEKGLRTLVLKSIERLTKEDADSHDVIIVDTYLQETMLREIYSATDIVLLPYRTLEQISSGNLAEAVGFGKPVISTEFYHAKELLEPLSLKKVQKMKPEEIDTRGLSVKLKGKHKNIPDVEQITEALEFLVFNETARHQIGINARKRGYEMAWPIVTDELLRFIGPIAETRFYMKQKPVVIRSEIRENGSASSSQKLESV